MRILAERRRPVGEGRGIRESHEEDIEDAEGDGMVPGALPVVQPTLPPALTLITLLPVHVAADGDGANFGDGSSTVLFTRGGEVPGCVDCRPCIDPSLL